MIQKINPKKGIQSGIEIEGQLIYKDGSLANRMTEVVTDPRNSGDITPELSHVMWEVIAPPSTSLDVLKSSFRERLKTLQEISNSYGLRNIPSSTLHNETEVKSRDPERPRGLRKRKILGNKLRDLEHHISGTHVHTDLLEDEEQAHSQVLLYTAMDPVFSFMSSSPFLFGKNSKNDYRVLTYRNEVFENLHKQGQLLDYPSSLKEAYDRQKQSYEEFKKILEAKGLDPEGLGESNCVWGPLRLTSFGTIEARGADTNLLSNVIALTGLYKGVAHYIEKENPQIEIDQSERYTPEEYFTPKKGKIILPSHNQLKRFEEIGATTGLRNTRLRNYLTNILETAEKGLDSPKHLEPFRNMIANKKNFADEIVEYAKNKGLEKNYQIDGHGARELRKYIAERHEEDLN
ncbi:hypothetical protein HOE04_01030 [archaeon]|jgi:gamma-glutamyl:cysteine ligase YbdK (ATP-grasp superfamily)|nr:hypothetical protein [archaeon]